MIIFKSNSDLQNLDPKNPAAPIIKDLIEKLITTYDLADRRYIPEDYGYIVLLEEVDMDSVMDLPELDCRLLEVQWEGATMIDGFYCAIYLANDEFGIAFLIPNADWLSVELRKLLAELLAY